MTSSFCNVHSEHNVAAVAVETEELPVNSHDDDVLDVEPDVSERRLSVSERAQLFMRLSELNRQEAQVTTRPRDPIQRR
jgi:hypothetical protein